MGWRWEFDIMDFGASSLKFIFLGQLVHLLVNLHNCPGQFLFGYRFSLWWIWDVLFQALQDPVLKSDSGQRAVKQDGAEDYYGILSGN